MALSQPAALLLLVLSLSFLVCVRCNPSIAAGVTLSRADKCAVCEATVHELIDDLNDSKNQPQQDLDLRGRLDPSGKRKGKVLQYHGSDLHMLELLDKVCDRMSDYSRSVSDDVVSLQRHNSRTEGGSVTLSNVEVDSKVSEKFKQYCGELVGGNEDDITSMVRSSTAPSARQRWRQSCRRPRVIPPPIPRFCAGEEGKVRAQENTEAPVLPSQQPVLGTQAARVCAAASRSLPLPPLF
jgi:hypothetical protein